ncbi:MAG: DegT/DnrJ/EryC1/StrS family aminotransferase [Planctomycetota bacterium]
MPDAANENTPTPVPMLDINRQNLPLREEVLEAVSGVCDSGAFLFGPAVRELEASVADYCDVEHAVGCASGSDALLLAMMALGIGCGDEVILPSFTFFASAGSVWRLGAKPVFADVIPETFNLDPADVERKLSPATKAIMPVHLFGQSAEMGAINAIAERQGLHVIEDAAQAIGSSYGGKPVGGLGAVGCFSFYPTKNLGGFGDGGMITTNDAELADKARVLCNHGQRPRYYHHYVGVNSRLDTLQAAVLGVKLKSLDGYAAGRTRHAERYNAAFGDGALGESIAIPSVAAGCGNVWNQYTIRVACMGDQANRRDALQQSLVDRKIGSAVYYPVPLHLQPCFASLGYQPGDLPHTEAACKEVLSLPVFPEMTSAEQETVIEAVTGFCAGANSLRGAA